MSSARLFRWSGGGLLIGSLLIIVGAILALVISGPIGPSGPPASIVALLSLIGVILVVLGFPGLYVRQAARTGWLGLLGFVLLFVATLLVGVGANVVAFVFFPALPLLRPGPPPAAILLFFLVTDFLAAIGGILFGIVTMRAGVFSRWAGLLFIIGSVLFLADLALLPPVPPAIFALVRGIRVVLLFLAVGWCGYALWFAKGETVPQPELTP